MNTKRRSSTVLGITPLLAASLVLAAGTAMAEDQQQTEAETQEIRQEITETSRTVRYEETTTIIGRGVTGDVLEPQANEIWPEYTQRELHLYDLGQMPGV